jgi:hypothetical protein
MNEAASQLYSSCAVGPSASDNRVSNAGHLIHIKRPSLGFAKRQAYRHYEKGHDIRCQVRQGTELASVFDDQATKAMGEAFEAACEVLDEAAQSSVVYEAVAKCIIEIANPASVIRTS